MSMKRRTAKVDLENMPGSSHAAQVVRLIRSDNTLLGDGTAGNPYRRAMELWTIGGQLVLRVDPMRRASRRKAEKLGSEDNNGLTGPAFMDAATDKPTRDQTGKGTSGLKAAG
jgi:hypothetical protein